VHRSCGCLSFLFHAATDCLIHMCKEMSYFCFIEYDFEGSFITAYGSDVSLPSFSAVYLPRVEFYIILPPQSDRKICSASSFKLECDRARDIFHWVPVIYCQWTVILLHEKIFDLLQFGSKLNEQLKYNMGYLLVEH
jgi:hypothetical protein